MFVLNPTGQVTRTSSPRFHLEQADIIAFLTELTQSKLEVELARTNFDSVDDPLLIDHAIYRLGAAEHRFNYLFQMARYFGIQVDEVLWDVMKEG